MSLYNLEAPSEPYNPTLHYLGTLVSHPEQGKGYITFEETHRPRRLRMLRVVFQEGPPMEGVQRVLRERGVQAHFEQPALRLPLEPASLLGHHAAIGKGLDERQVRESLTALKAVRS